MYKNLIIVFLLGLLTYEVNDQKRVSFEKPTSKGIDKHLIDSTEHYIRQFERFVNDTFQFDLYVYCEDLSETSDYDSTELARFYVPDQIVVTNQEKFVAYRLADVPRYKQKQYEKNNAFVKGVLLHEIAHAYFTQCILVRRFNQQDINPAYNNFRLFPATESNFGSNFIEEGFCEYCVQKMNESIVAEKYYKPQTIEEVMNPRNMYNLKYEYASYYLREFLDIVGIKQGLQILITNRPPSYEEILKPDLYFSRIL